jgi:hypothetical protein
MRLLFIPGTKSCEPEKYSNKQTDGAPQQVDPEVEVVGPELIGHRWHGSMFMSAQWGAFC